jgi:hypothetical protein
MHKLATGVLALSIVCGHCAWAQDSGTTNSDYPPNFPPSGYRPLPPHFQSRRVIAANPEQVTTAPPPLPSYRQPAIPESGYLWVPGFWAWPPQSGLLWTPPYWSQVDGGYAYHAGYWATEVGFYGGINYGFGYTGSGYVGGRWNNGSFTYNSAVNNLGSLDNISAYDQAVEIEDDASHVSYNGGERGTSARPTQQQEKLANGEHIGPTREQRKQFELAAMDRSLYSKLNNAEPGVTATRRAGILTDAGVTPRKPP